MSSVLPVEYVDVATARERPGLRLVLTAGVPGPWGEAAKAFFHVKDVPYTAVAQGGGQANEEVVSWTGTRNAPQAIYEDERPRDRLEDILYLAEALAPMPRLVPEDPAQRARMFGGVREIAGTQGLGWLRRLQLLHPALSSGAELPAPMKATMETLGYAYDYSPAAAEAATARIRAILDWLAAWLEAERGAGRDYFVGGELSALDLVWATFTAIIRPLPEQLCPMNPFMRAQYDASDDHLGGPLPAILIEHRDRIYERHLELPVRC